MRKKKTVDMEMVREALANLKQIAHEHPELVDRETPREELQKQWEETLQGVLLADKTTFTIEEAAELLSCHKDTVRRAIRSGKLKAGKIGKDYRISRSDVEEYYRASGGGQLFPKIES
jgi:excisionase family DNA binding protein